MTALMISIRHDVEQERFHVVVQRLVVKEEFGEQAQLLAILLVLTAVHLPYA